MLVTSWSATGALLYRPLVGGTGMHVGDRARRAPVIIEITNMPQPSITYLYVLRMGEQRAAQRTGRAHKPRIIFLVYTYGEPREVSHVLARSPGVPPRAFPAAGRQARAAAWVTSRRRWRRDPGGTWRVVASASFHVGVASRHCRDRRASSRYHARETFFFSTNTKVLTRQPRGTMPMSTLWTSHLGGRCSVRAIANRFH